MIVVDSSAIVAVLFDEPGADQIAQKLVSSECVMSAATRVELGIVIEAKAGAPATLLLEELLERVELRLVAVDELTVRESILAWRRFGKGRHRAALNFGDVFAYALAVQLGVPLLCVGDDFAHTDVELA